VRYGLSFKINARVLTFKGVINLPLFDKRQYFTVIKSLSVLSFQKPVTPELLFPELIIQVDNFIIISNILLHWLY